MGEAPKLASGGKPGEDSIIDEGTSDTEFSGD
jgi:hypothetical protein